MSAVFQLPQQVRLKSSGVPYDNATAEFFETATVTPKDVYTDAALSVPYSQPISAGADGQFQTIYVNALENYKAIIKDKNGVQIDSIDPAFSALFTQAQLASVLYPITLAEASAGLVAADLTTLYQPYDARRYGADVTGVTDSTVALSKWISAALQSGVGYLPAGTYKATSITAALSGNRITQSVLLYGDGRVASRLQQVASTAAALLTITSTSPNASVAALPIVVRDIGLFGSSKFAGSIGLATNSIAQFNFDRLLVRGFETGVSIYSALIGRFTACEVSDNKDGYVARLNATLNVYNNDLQIVGGRCYANSRFGMDIGDANVFTAREVDIEANGTAGAGTAQGAIIIRNTCDDEIGLTEINLENLWIEGNFGRGIQVESGMTEAGINIRGGHCMTQENGLAIVIGGARSVLIDAFQSPSTGMTWDITADRLRAMNSITYTLTDTNVAYPTYTNLSTNAAAYINGQTNSFTGTLTGCTTSPTASVSWCVQGDEVALTFPDLRATSNTTACTITGMPTNLRPGGTRVCSGAMTEDSGADSVSFVSIASTGVITLYKGASATFTGSGSKGVLPSTVRYKR